MRKLTRTDGTLVHLVQVFSLGDKGQSPGTTGVYELPNLRLVLADQRDETDFRGREPLSRCEKDLGPLHSHGARPGCTVRQIRFPSSSGIERTRTTNPKGKAANRKLPSLQIPNNPTGRATPLKEYPPRDVGS